MLVQGEEKWGGGGGSGFAVSNKLSPGLGSLIKGGEVVAFFSGKDDKLCASPLCWANSMIGFVV